MVDTIRYKDQFLADLRERLDVETNDDINYVKFPEYMDAELPDKKDKKEKEKKSDKEIAVVYCTGGIEGGKGGPATIGSKETSEAIRDARKDSSVKAVVLRVNSPGGSALASDVIWREVVLTRDEKPVVVSMGDVAASGGYYISCAADHIYAMPNTITGSIGVFGIIPNTEPFYEENLDINFERVRTNPHADLGTINRAMNKKERKVMNQGIVETYQTFIEKVAKGRDMSTEMVDSLGRGRVWSGLDALDNGLVDELGGMKKAIEKAAELAEIEDYETRALPEIKSPIEKVMDKLTGKARTKLIKSEFGDHGYRIYKRFRYIRSLTKMEGIQARLPYQVTVR